jgi:hypothetical protein
MRVVTLSTVMLVSCDIDAQPAGRRRAVLVGINDYSASELSVHQPPPAEREWRNLAGAVNDVAALREMLVPLYGFDRNDIVTLTDQSATRVAILQSLEQLAASAAKDDVLLFYFAGHGSQVRNSLSDEPDKLDETIVPADSRAGAADIRDKELRLIFNRMLDRGARLTVILDNCYSGSGARGLPTGARPRGLNAYLRDIADRTSGGPRPEDRGALILSAAQDSDRAWETRDEEGRMHGAFSWAWIRAMRDSSPGESAFETFLRAQARLRAEMPFQEPVFAGNAEARLQPFLGERLDRPGDRSVVGIEKIRADGTVMLQGGWANGLSVDTELRLLDDRQTDVRLIVTALRGLTRGEARLQPSGRTMPQTIRSGALLEVVGWAAPPSRPLRVWTPRMSIDVDEIAKLARKLENVATRRGIRWIDDPTESTPTHLLRRGSRQWELLGPSGEIQRFGADASDAAIAVSRIPPASSLFVQLPSPSIWIDAMAIGCGDTHGAINAAEDAEEADYILVGRQAEHRISYAWIRPLAKTSDRRKSGLPLRSDWIVADDRDQTMHVALGDMMRKLRRIHAWHLLDSPPETRFLYHLGMRNDRDGEWSEDSVIGDEKYELVLRTTSMTARMEPRYIYAFTIDSHGKSVLLFPRNGSVENRFPLPSSDAPAEISLGAPGTFEVVPPYGVDTYFLLTTDEPLPNPWILEWAGVRGGSSRPRTAIEELLLVTGAMARSRFRNVTSTWSIERVVVESIPRKKTAMARQRATNSRQ